MSAPPLPNEPYHGDEALCGECGAPISLSESEGRFEGTQDAPDGLPAPMFVAICKECRAHPEPTDREDG